MKTPGDESNRYVVPGLETFVEVAVEAVRNFYHICEESLTNSKSAHWIEKRLRRLSIATEQSLSDIQAPCLWRVF